MKSTNLIVIAGLFLFGCPKSEKKAEPPKAEKKAEVNKAAPASKPAMKKIHGPYALQPKNDSGIGGEVKLEAVEGGVKVSVSVKNAPPGKHGTHIHEKGDCSSPDGKSAGGHFNPKGVDHGMPEGAPHHLGDLGNIEIGEDGTGSLEATMTGATLDGGELSFIGRALIFHEKVDDGGQPTGNAGARLGCAELK
ncbi:MAG: superoxide dismutase family protein [Deltaproteobacteria bacterium]